MGIVEETLAHWRRQRTDLLDRLTKLECGTELYSARRDAEWVDTTPDLIGELKDQLGELDRLIAQYEKRSVMIRIDGFGG